MTMTAHACPSCPAICCANSCGSQVRGAVVTSASLTSCGSFDYFLGESRAGRPAPGAAPGGSQPVRLRQTGRAHRGPKPWPTPARPTSTPREMVAACCATCEKVKRGALVLFTSRVQMRAAVDRAAGPSCWTWCWCKASFTHPFVGQPAARVESGGSVGDLWHAVLWRRPGLARSAVRNRVHRQLPFSPPPTRSKKRVPNGSSAKGATRLPNW